MRALLLVLLLAACATSREAGSGSGSGTLALKSYANAAAPPVTYSVGNGVISSSNLDLRLDQDCIRGSMRRNPVQLCKDPANPNRWNGDSGDFTAIVSPDGKSVNVNGFLYLGSSLRQADISQVLPIGEGPAWDEMRKNPALLVMATAATDLEALQRNRR